MNTIAFAFSICFSSVSGVIGARSHTPCSTSIIIYLRRHCGRGGRQFWRVLVCDRMRYKLCASHIIMKQLSVFSMRRLQNALLQWNLAKIIIVLIFYRVKLERRHFQPMKDGVRSSHHTNLHCHANRKLINFTTNKESIDRSRTNNCGCRHSTPYGLLAVLALDSRSPKCETWRKWVKKGNQLHARVPMHWRCEI